MKLRSDISEAEFEALMQLYVEAFPPEERRPLEEMPPADAAYRFYAIDGCGLLSTWEFEDFTYIEHFAIRAELRGSGIGSAALAALRGNLILEVEPPHTGTTARRRIAFYKRNGFRLLNIAYVQPPYSKDLPSVELRLMVRGAISDIDAAIRTIHRRVYGVI